ncbi:riboflavin synthase alpha chain [Corynebacterium pollutisoli]|uniref:Riboflavin synthase n=1 Tax=Corynebacterium pollutisoli TaxID=1610489 RepID=A0A1X7JRW5_9CORY|nr:riboflavin synthase [Corynebacterium pollutisoli]NLP39450.1 riboflavin synthase [Corynebacterium pollutisoli]SMG31101.1 riboflavin synthase alpha chain [Corynebacterium pollutisoli]
MFTGLVEEIGRVDKLEPQGDALRLTIGAGKVLSDVSFGDSIAVNGVCLTVVEHTDEWFTADVMQESLDRTGLGQLEVGSRVNLERALAAGARLGGHIMQGHVDGTSRLLSRTSSEHWDVLRFSLDAALARYVVEKGSIAVNGTSLTVSAVGEDYFEVSLIPTTLAETTHGELVEGSVVNIEVDVLAKYVEKMLGGRADAQPATPER